MGNTEWVNGFQPWLYTSIISGSFTNTNGQALAQTNELKLLESRILYFILKISQVILIYRQDCKPLS